ncbi:hypothetical protein CSA37_01580 [Candidatus Fermentibacteria bacterium]|nr:MAG: hypothetical protein CSA37_13550 [Candidatus Fermentibacteria bacterium]PIE53374.1 MAG: hypothetical protein CSA37_01580 [Candidatus Fermentibacteria bacterium]
MAGRRANSIYMLAGQILGKAGLFISLMIYSRILDDRSFGELLFATSVSLILFFLADMGASLVSTRRLTAEEKHGKILSTALLLRTILTVFSTVLLLTLIAVMGYEKTQVMFLYLVYPGFILDGYCETFYALFRAREKMYFEGLARGVQGFLAVLMAFAVRRYSAGIELIALTYTARSLVPLILCVWGAFTIIGIRPVFQGQSREVKRLLLVSLPLSIMGFLVVAGQRIDSTLVKAFISDSAVAAWQQCYRLFEPLVLLVAPTLLPGALFPDLCRAQRKSWRMVRLRIQWMTEVFTTGAFSLVIPVYFLGLQFLHAVWGPGFLRGQSSEHVQWAFSILMFCLPVTYWFHIFLATVLAQERQKSVLPGAFAAFLLQLAGLYASLEVLGLPAAAVMQFVFISTLTLWLALGIRRRYGPTGFSAGLKRPFISIIPFALTAFFEPFDNWLNALVSLVGFMTIWVLSGGVSAAVNPPQKLVPMCTNQRNIV